MKNLNKIQITISGLPMTGKTLIGLTIARHLEKCGCAVKLNDDVSEMISKFPHYATLVCKNTEVIISTKDVKKEKYVNESKS